jgi:uncharacterized protein (TIGR02118 family)
LNQCETFGLPGNRIELPLLEVDEGTANDLPNGWRNTVELLKISLC